MLTKIRIYYDFYTLRVHKTRINMYLITVLNHNIIIYICNKNNLINNTINNKNKNKINNCVTQFSGNCGMI